MTDTRPTSSNYSSTPLVNSQAVKFLNFLFCRKSAIMHVHARRVCLKHNYDWRPEITRSSWYQYHTWCCPACSQLEYTYIRRRCSSLRSSNQPLCKPHSKIFTDDRSLARAGFNGIGIVGTCIGAYDVEGAY